MVCLAQTQSCCKVFVCGINGMFCMYMGGQVGGWLGKRCVVFLCACLIFLAFLQYFSEPTVKSHSTHRSKLQTTYGFGLLEAYMNNIKSSSGSSVTQG